MADRPQSTEPFRLTALPDEVLVRQARGGNGSAASRLAARYREAMLRFCHAQLGQLQDAEDAAQDVLAKLADAESLPHRRLSAVALPRRPQPLPEPAEAPRRWPGRGGLGGARLALTGTRHTFVYCSGGPWL